MKTEYSLSKQIMVSVRWFSALTLAALAVFAAVGSLRASVIVAWDAKPANTTLSSATAFTNDANLSGPVTLTLGPGFTPNSVGNTFGGYYTGDTSSGLASANSHGTYFEFTLTPASGYQVQITDLVVPTSYNPGQQYGLFIWQGSAACAINLASSSDSYGSSLGTVSPTGLGSDAGYWTLHLNSPLIISSAVTFRIEFSENFGYKTIGLQPDRSFYDPALLHNALEIVGSVTPTGGGSQPATTTTTLGSSPNPSTVGQSVTFTATVQTNSPTGTATAATGNVVFKDGGTTVYTGSIANGVATYTTSGLSVGTHAFTAVYSGDSNYGTSTSAATNQTVNGNATTTSLGSSPNPSTFGQSVTFTATLQTNGATATGVTGNVVFKDGATAVYTNSSITSGVATYITSGLTAGTHTFTAVYSGDSNYATSTSTATNQTVNGAVSSGPTPITYSGLEGLTVGGINGQNDNASQWYAGWSVQNGDNSNYTVQNATPLTFGNLATSSDGKYLDGGGGFLQMGRRLPTGYQSIWDANGSVSDPFTAGQIDRGTVWGSFLLRVNSSITSWDSAKIGFNSSPTPYQFSGSTGLQIATVNGNSSWGVRLGDNGTASTLGSVSVGSTVFVVIKFELSTTAGANNAYVWMFSNSSAANLGGADLNTGTAMASITGKDTTDLRFKAIGFYLDNTANRVDVDEIRFGTSYASVSPVPVATTKTTTTTLGSSPNPSGYGQSVTFTATVQTNGVTATGASGNVVFSSANGAFSTNTLSGGTAASLSIANLPRGTNTITVTYLGDGNLLGSTNTLNQIVTNHPPAANVMAVTRTAGLALIIKLSDLSTNWSDADDDTMELAGVTMQSTNGINLIALNWSTNFDGSIVTTNAYAFIGYTNSPNVNDQISYSINDGFGGTNIGYVNIVIQGSVTGTNSITAHDFTSPYSNTITAYGIPNFYYILERSTNLTSPVWVDVQTNQAATNGVIRAADTFWDLGGFKPSPSAFYQLKWQP